MATRYHNLSEYDANTLPDASVLKDKKIAVVVADWNDDITYPLCDGAVDALVSNGVPTENVSIFHVPGAFELTFAAKKLMEKKSESDKNERFFDAIVIIGCVIQGDTPHFDYVCQGVTEGATMLNAEGVIPVIFSVLTTLNKQQALDRAGGVLGNKGVEGAITALKMIKVFGSVR